MTRLSDRLAAFHNETLKDGARVQSREVVSAGEPEPAWWSKIIDEDRIGYAEEQRRERARMNIANTPGGKA